MLTCQILFGSILFDRNSYGTQMKLRRHYSALHKNAMIINATASCVPFKYSNTCHSSNCDLYNTLATLVTKLAIEHNICMLLDSGSLLGAHRHFGFMEWDKDTDFAVFSTNTTAIETVLEEMSSEFKLTWHYVGREIDGNKDRGRGFGYHIDVSHSKQYIDLWLWNRVGPDLVGCVGINNGCEWWYLSNWKQKPPSYKEEFYNKIQLIPFGNFFMPAPYGGKQVLDKKYGDWRTKCGGWQTGDKLCRFLYETHPFVFDLNTTDDGMLTWKVLKQGNSVLSYFTVDSSGIYNYIGDG